MSQQPPNILFITTDHLRWDTLGCNGDPCVKTPAIDSLARDGSQFSQCYVQNPACQPSRATLMTGRYPRNHGQRWMMSELNEGEVTLMELFHRRNYQTASIGKHDIQQKRFRDALDHHEAPAIRNMNPGNVFVEYVKSRGFDYKTADALPGLRERLGAVPSELPDDCHIDSYVGARSIDYLEKVDSSRPWMLWAGFYGPHHPYVPSGQFAKMYDPEKVPPFHRSDDDLDRKPPEYRVFRDLPSHKFAGFSKASERTWREMKAAYYGMVTQIDVQIGRILETLTKRGMRSNTIIVFTSDHGEFLGDNGFPGKGPFLLDCLLRVPCIFSGPGVPRGASSDALTESVDLFPTIAKLAGAEKPEWVQGIDLVPLMTRKTEKVRDVVYAEVVDKKMLRTRDWKLIHYANKPYGELYDLREDPHELRNLYAERPQLVEKMTQQLYRHLDATEDFAHPSYGHYRGVDAKTGKEVRHYKLW